MSLGTEDAEATLKLAEAINRLAAAIEQVTASTGPQRGLQLFHYHQGLGYGGAAGWATGGSGGQ